jgi:PhzF family phenazine biosynthesis protein
MKLPIYQVDAFSNKLFAGNPAAVCPLKEWLPDKTMQAIAAENNLAETAFFVPLDTGYRLRWFTPAIEVDLCGHATLATAHVLFAHLGYEQEEIRFQTRSGELKVSQANDWYQMDFPADKLKEVNHIPEAISEGLGFTPQQVYRGRDDYMVIVDNQAQIEALQPDFRALLQLGSRGLIVTAKGDEVDFVSRCFFPPAGIDEDPVTGSAHTSMTPYWSKVLNKKEMTAMQLSSRTGFVKCTLNGDRVLLSGQAITYLEGEIEV